MNVQCYCLRPQPNPSHFFSQSVVQTLCSTFFIRRLIVILITLCDFFFVLSHSFFCVCVCVSVIHHFSEKITKLHLKMIYSTGGCVFLSRGPVGIACCVAHKCNCLDVVTCEWNVFPHV